MKARIISGTAARKTKGICAAVVFMLIIPALNAYGLSFSRQDLSIMTSVSYVSRYVWRGQDLYPENDGAFQPQIDITLEDFLSQIDATLNVWASYATADGHEVADEQDYTFLFSRDFSDGLISGVIGYTYFDYPNLNDTSDAMESWLSVSLNEIATLPITFTVFAGYDFKAASGGPDEGWYYSWEISSRLTLPEGPLAQKDQVLTMGVTNWGNDGVADLKSSFLYATDIFAQTEYECAGLIISPSVHYVINHEDAINSGDEEMWFGVEIGYSF